MICAKCKKEQSTTWLTLKVDAISFVLCGECYRTTLSGTEKEEEQQPRAKQAREVLDELNAARKRVMPLCRTLGPTPENLRRIAERLQHNTVMDCLAVVSVYEKDVVRSHAVGQWFNAVTPFRPDNFARALARATDNEIEPETQIGQLDL